MIMVSLEAGAVGNTMNGIRKEKKEVTTLIILLTLVGGGKEMEEREEDGKNGWQHIEG